MNLKEINQRYNEININNKILCTQEELDNFLVSGLLFKSGKSYKNKASEKVIVSILEDPEYDFDFNLSKIIKACEDKCKENKINRIYCMSKKLYNYYKSQDLIIEKDSKEYYRYYEKELWLICIF